VRIRLEYEDGPVFATLGGPLGSYRTLLVKINGKPFTAWCVLDSTGYMSIDHERYAKEIDKALVASMERMLGKVFLDACAAVPEGTDLMCDINGEQRSGQ
jgi:hypothetical protein